MAIFQIIPQSYQKKEPNELNGGEDPLKRKYFDDYKKTRNGKKHIKDRPKKIDTKNATIEF